ncbi:uncharacterized protein [Phyllobates terribilis]|uniref:uncharacterized protein isoform X2 n=1 Tax=Phyllobates terribilis TaxID=111132 RepID=UPI003CCB4F26
MPAVSKGDGMRGLAVFISDIRNCKSKEAEIKRINKELANIRSKFKGGLTSPSPLSYSKMEKWDQTLNIHGRMPPSLDTCGRWPMLDTGSPTSLLVKILSTSICPANSSATRQNRHYLQLIADVIQILHILLSLLHVLA